MWRGGEGGRHAARRDDDYNHHPDVGVFPHASFFIGTMLFNLLLRVRASFKWLVGLDSCSRQVGCSQVVVGD